jgi:hypothetical protein
MFNYYERNKEYSNMNVAPRRDNECPQDNENHRLQEAFTSSLAEESLSRHNPNDEVDAQNISLHLGTITVEGLESANARRAWEDDNRRQGRSDTCE